MKPVAIDLFCGKGGWTNGLLEAGFEVYGFDIEPQPDYKGIFVQCDILALTADDLRKYGSSFATCSSPCEQFSVHGMKHFHPNPKYPEMGIKLFNHSRELLEELDIPYVMENVAAARKFVGPSTNHCGPFHLWGPGVPAVMPREVFQVTKGMSRGSSSVCKTLSGIALNEYRKAHSGNGRNGYSSSKARKEETARAAMIALPIARAVAETAWNLTQALEVA
jgi:hypothetical protein